MKYVKITRLRWIQVTKWAVNRKGIFTTWTYLIDWQINKMRPPAYLPEGAEINNYIFLRCDRGLYGLFRCCFIWNIFWISQRNFGLIAFYKINNRTIGFIDDVPIFGDINVCQFLFFSWRMSEGEIDNIIADAAMIPCNRCPCTPESIGFQIRKIDYFSYPFQSLIYRCLHIYDEIQTGVLP